MTTYFSPSKRAFYSSEVHGSPTTIVDGEEVRNPDCVMPADAEAMTDAEHAALIAGQASGQVIDWSGARPVLADAPEPTAEQLWLLLREQARRALTESDITVLRCAEAAVPVPQAWRDYRAALRAIVSAESGDPTHGLPAQPAYPPGT